MWHSKTPRYIISTLFFPPWFIAGVTAFLLVFPGQMHEVYLSLLGEDGGIAQALAGLGMLLMLSAFLYCWASQLSISAIDVAYPDHANLGIDRTLFGFSNGNALFCAMLPPAGLALGLYRVLEQAQETKGKLEQVWKGFKGPINQSVPGADELARFIDAAPGAIIIVIACAGVLLWLTHRRRNDPRTQRLVMGMAGMIAAVALLGLPATEAHAVGISRWLGPLLVPASAMISAAVVLMGLTWLSRFFRVPVIKVLLALGLVIAWQKFNHVAPKAAKTTSNQNGERPRQPELLLNRFRAWLDDRDPEEKALYAAAGKSYPVFIIAAQGGGIYAASAAATFLASLQARCPNFAQHVFAVSGVSGGAVGSALFHGLMQGVSQAISADCPVLSGRPAQVDSVDRIVRADHFSPIAAFVLPDMLRKIVPFTSEPSWNRADILAESFRLSFESEHKFPSRGFFACPAQFDKGLSAPFAGHWCEHSVSPALVLNATWVETGFRIAFSPFALHNQVGDGTLWAMSDTLDALGQTSSTVPDGLSLIKAAMVSARFPGMVPAWPFSFKVPVATKSQPDTHVWNFVDGGYADGSGANTADDLYKAIKRGLDPTMDIDLHLILLTEDYPEEDIARLNGSGFHDTLAPLTALLNVRSLLAVRAVTEAKSTRDESRLGHVHLVKLDLNTFQLPLAWKISRASNQIVQRMVVDFDLCGRDHTNDAPTPDDNLQRTLQIKSAVEVVRNNSCVVDKVMKLLTLN